MKTLRYLKPLALVASLAAGSWVSGCGSDNNNNNHDGSTGAGGHAGNGGAAGIGGTGGGASPDGGQTDAGVLASDGQIASVMLEANSGEVAAATVALAKATSPAVVTFATMMVSDHTMANGRLAIILQQQNITAADSTVRQMLAMQAAQTVTTLLATPASAFDQAYVTSQISMHTMVLQLLDAQLIPKAQNATLKAELQMERTAVMAHLTAAQQLASSLADGGVTATGDAGNNADAAQGN
jgi:putative membrane protein